MRNTKLFWHLDYQIRAPEVRVIGSDGKQLGVMKTDEALKQAKSEGLTLVEIAPTAKPPVAKIVDFGKFRYQEEKKLRTQLKKTKASELKEIRFSPFIAVNDYNTRLRRVREFLQNKDKVRLVVVFTGRQMGSKPQGYELLKRIITELGESISVDMSPKFLGKHLMMIVSPVAKRIKEKSSVAKSPEGDVPATEDKDAKTEN